MSLYALPVSSSDLTALQQGIQFTTNPGEANTQADAIKNGSTTVFAYAQSLLGKSVSTSQVAMADFAYALGKTDTVAHLGGIATGFLPPQVKFAVDNNLAGGSTVYAAQVYSLALATSFADFRTSLTSQVANNTFITTTANLTGTNASAIQSFFGVWLAFYTANPTAAPGLTANQAAAASAWGDAMGAALDRGPNDTGPGIDAARAIQTAVANALFDNAQTSSSPPGAKYAEGVAIGSLPTHTKFQGEGVGKTFTFTLGTDTFAGTTGDDTFAGVIQANGTGINVPSSTLSPLQNDSATGGGGIDTIKLIVAPGGASLTAVASLVTGVAKWSLDETQGSITDAGGIDVSKLNSATFIEQIANAAAGFVDVKNVGTGATVGFTSTATAPVTNNITVDKNVDNATVLLKDVGAANLTFAETTAGTLTKVEVDGSAANLIVSLTAAAVSTIVLGITSTTPTPITLAGNTTALKTIDAKTSTGALTLDVSTAAFKNVTSVTLGSGIDTLKDDLANKAAPTVSVDLGGGADTYNVNLNAAAAAVALNITLGTGADTVNVAAKVTNIKDAPNAANVDPQLVTITDFKATDPDTLNIKNAGVTFTKIDGATQANIDAAANLFAAVTIDAAAIGATNGSIFSFQGNAYVFQNDANAAFSAGDGLIKVVGVSSTDLVAHFNV
jgi:hypothetical protein